MTKKNISKYTAEELERYFTDPAYRREHTQNGDEPRKPRRWLRRIIVLGIIVAALGGYGVYLFSGLPSLEKIENPKPELATRVYSADGEVLDRFFIKNRSNVSLNEIPRTLVHALIATEDKNFYNHWGVDAIRFFKAITKMVITLGSRREGASTITMQLSRSLYLGHDDKHVFDTVTRKIREFITAIQLERNFTKDEILEFYLNVVLFGRGTYGVAAAAHEYFGKAPVDLSLSESAMLIAVLPGPAYYDPARHAERALSRRNLVLSQMVKYGYITESVAEQTKQEPITLRASDEFALTGIAPHFVEYVRQEMAEKAEEYRFDIYRDGASVYTTLDSRMQRHANQAVEEHLAKYQAMFDKQWNWSHEQEAQDFVIDQAIRTSPEFRAAVTVGERDSVAAALKANEAWVDSMKHQAQQIEVGLVALDPQTGGILAMVGGSNFKRFKYGLNHVTQIRRHPGSAFKPFVYTVAIDNGYPPSYEIMNQPVILMMPDGKRWAPDNFDKSTGGKYTIREAIQNSINLVTVRAMEKIAPVNLVIDYAKRMGVTSPLQPYASLALGAADISPMEMAAAFSVFANHGVYVHPFGVYRIEDKDNNLIEETTPVQREVMSEETAFIMTSMLEGVVNGGTGNHVRDYFRLPAAGKTGTTNDYVDAWFIGFTPHICAAIWIGFDNKSVRFKTADGQGGRAAAPLWGLFMKYIYEDPSIGLPLEYFEKPDKVIEQVICTDTKKIATEYCPSTYTEYFTAKTLPGKCDKHTSAKWRENEEGLGKISF